MTQTSLFDLPPPVMDLAEGLRRKEEGQIQAVENNAALVIEAREIAVKLATIKGEITMDDVVLGMVEKGYGWHCLGNSAGGVFRDKRFEWTGRYHKSERIWANGNELKIWRLKDAQ